MSDIVKPRAILRRKKVLERVGLSKSTVYNMISKRMFPAQVLLVPGGRAVGWREEQIDLYVLGCRSF